MFERDWGNHAALWRSGVGVADAPVFQYASTQPFVDQVQQHIVTHPTSKKLSQVAVIQIVEKLSDIHFKYKAAPTVHQLVPESFQRLMCRSPRPESVRALQKVVFVNRLQQHDNRALEDLILQCGNSERACLGTRAVFRNIHTPHWRAWYVPEFARSRIRCRLPSRSRSKSSAFTPSTPTAPSLRGRRYASFSQSRSIR